MGGQSMREPEEPSGNLHSRRQLLSRSARLAGSLVLAAPTAELLAGCGGGSASGSQASSASGGVSAPSAEQIAHARGTVKVLGWNYYEVPQFDTAKVKAKWGYLGANEDTIT